MVRESEEGNEFLLISLVKNIKTFLNMDITDILTIFKSLETKIPFSFKVLWLKIASCDSSGPWFSIVKKWRSNASKLCSS